MFALDDADRFCAMDPEFLKPHESKAVKVTIKVNGSERVSLTRIQVEDGLK